jgi:type I restriction enzyme S subunit
VSVTTDEFVDYLTANADGSAYPAVRPEHFDRAPIVIPDGGVLRSFNLVVEPLLRRIAANERESRTLAGTRDALLPKLVSGEIRIASQI